jgi:hypothetical protein
VLIKDLLNGGIAAADCEFVVTATPGAKRIMISCPRTGTDNIIIVIKKKIVRDVLFKYILLIKSA